MQKTLFKKKNQIISDQFLKRGIIVALVLILFILATSYTETQPIQEKREVNQPTPSVILQAKEKTIVVNGKESRVFSLTQPDGTPGYKAQKGQTFNVHLENKIPVATSIHWHGLILPNDQDGVAFITQLPLYPGQSYHYQFPLVQSGTYWMHSHLGLQEQKLLSAPLIIKDPEETKLAEQEVVLFLNDFSFTSPQKIYEELQCDPKRKMDMSAMKSQEPDIVEVDYDAFLANERTLESPEIILVKPGSRVRLRIINGASSTNFFLSLGQLKGIAIAVDGNRIKSLEGSYFELGVAQRMDILVTIPERGGSFPVLAIGEGTNLQTGIILATQGASLPKLSSRIQEKAGRLTNEQETQLSALFPFAEKPVDKRLEVVLGGDMANYRWTLNGQSWPEVTPLVVEKGQRVELTFKNATSMTHPMHLHGHVFQVTAINGKPISGAIRDTILVTPHSSVTIQFDANNPGVWPLHCHVLYHLEAGMLTVLRYKDFIQPLVPITSY